MIRRAVERAWGVASHVHAGCETSARLGLALFDGTCSERQMLCAPTLPDIITLSFDPDAGTLLLTPAGEASVVTVRGTWRRLQIFLPDASIAAIAAELGLPPECRIAFEPGTLADPDISALAGGLAAQLESGLPVSALQLDETALELALLLVTRHGKIVLDEDVAESSPWERALIEAILVQLRDSPEDAPRLLQALLRKAMRGAAGGNGGILN